MAKPQVVKLQKDAPIQPRDEALGWLLKAGSTVIRDVKAIQLSSNHYAVVELAFDVVSQRLEVKVLQKDVARVPAEDEVRLWYENHIGHNRFGGSGL